MQTLFSNIGALVGAFRPIEKPSTAIQNITRSKSDRLESSSENERLPERDESWYWMMHAHW